MDWLLEVTPVFLELGNELAGLLCSCGPNGGVVLRAFHSQCAVRLILLLLLVSLLSAGLL
jgi:hypothetical protein